MSICDCLFSWWRTYQPPHSVESPVTSNADPRPETAFQSGDQSPITQIEANQPTFPHAALTSSIPTHGVVRRVPAPLSVYTDASLPPIPVPPSPSDTSSVDSHCSSE